VRDIHARIVYDHAEVVGGNAYPTKLPGARDYPVVKRVRREVYAALDAVIKDNAAIFQPRFRAAWHFQAHRKWSVRAMVFVAAAPAGIQAAAVLEWDTRIFGYPAADIHVFFCTSAAVGQTLPD
jgi:hypothetical protein